MSIMKITSNLNHYNSSQRKNNNSSLSFGELDMFINVKPNKYLKTSNIYLRTYLVRGEEFWNEFSAYIQKKYPEGVKIICHAAADGSDAYTAAMRLIDDLGNNGAAKYFPIVASDISNKALMKMRNRIINVSDNEKILLEKSLKTFDKSYFFDGDKNILRVKDILYSKIQPRMANIMNEVDKYKKHKEPCIVIFRNAWYQLNDQGKRLLSQKLYDNLKPESSVVIGKQDAVMIPELLVSAGFHPVLLPNLGNCYIFEKPLLSSIV